MAQQAALDEKKDMRGTGFPQVLHDRARASAEELHKLLLSLSTAGVGVYFFAVTGNEPRLSGFGKASVFFAMICFAVAVLAGTTGWYADCRRNYFWASALQAEDKNDRSGLYRSRDRWLRLMRISAKCLVIFFLLGIAASVLYMTVRISGS